MRCPKCGAEYEENETFCGDCGNPLPAPEQTYPSTQPQQSYPLTQPSTAQASQSPVLAAILNFLFPGLGYWYLGYRKVFGMHPALFFIAVWIVGAATAATMFLFFVPFVICAFLAYDVYLKATGKPGWIDAKRV